MSRIHEVQHTQKMRKEREEREALESRLTEMAVEQAGELVRGLAAREAQPTPRTHDLKTWPEFFRAIQSGEKNFECRINDRGYEVGDVLVLREWNKVMEHYTGNECRRVVTYILTDKFPALSLGWCVLGLQALPVPPAPRAPAAGWNYEDIYGGCMALHVFPLSLHAFNSGFWELTTGTCAMSSGNANTDTIEAAQLAAEDALAALATSILRTLGRQT